MAYWLDVYRFPNSTEYEYKWAGKYGAKGEKRGKRAKATPEQIKRQNQQNREKYVRRLIKANFFPEDLWVTLKYPAGTRKPLREVKKDMKNFLDSLRGKYRRRGRELKFLLRMEIGRKGGIHVHLIVPRIRGEDTDLLVQGSWKHGRAHFESVHEGGGYEKLAAYLVKQPDEEMREQLSLFPEEERKEMVKYSSSRNLERPRPERRRYRRRTLRKLLAEGPKASEGYWIDKNTVYAGTNRFTGYSYLRYTECRAGTVRSREEWERLRKGGTRDG